MSTISSLDTRPSFGWISRCAVFASGAVSVLVFVYLAVLHCLLVFGGRGRLSEFMTPSMFVFHAASCILGAGLTVFFFVHIWRREKPLKSRILWIALTAIGYGMVFYWYRHVFRGGAIQEVSDQAGRGQSNDT